MKPSESKSHQRHDHRDHEHSSSRRDSEHRRKRAASPEAIASRRTTGESTNERSPKLAFSKSPERDLKVAKRSVEGNDLSQSTPSRRQEEWARATAKGNTIVFLNVLPLISYATPVFELYKVDVRPDRDNLAYARPFKRPAYYRFGHGRVLGLGRQFKIVEEPSKQNNRAGYGGLEIYEPERDSAIRDVSKSWKLTSEPRRIRKEKTGDNSDQFEKEVEFIALSSRSTATKKNYTGIESLLGMANENDEDVDKDDDLMSDSDLEAHTNATSRIVQLSQAVETSPNDESLWFSLAAEMMANAGSTSEPNMTKIRNEVGLSVFQKAIAANPGNTRLILRFLEIFETLNGKYQTIKQWGNMIDKYPTSHQLWIPWIEFLIRDTAAFEYDSVLQNIIQIIDRISVFIEPSCDDIAELENNLLAVIMRACAFILEAGYIEHAIAIVQGLLQLNLFCPESETNKLGWLETFWMDERPRIGDYNLELKSDIDRQDWLLKESISAKKSMPERIDALTDTNDPYSIILYSDISPFMSIFSGPDRKINLVWACLKFLGCRIPNYDYLPFLDHWDANFSLGADAHSTTGGGITNQLLVSSVIDSLLLVVDDDEILSFCLNLKLLIDGEKPTSNAAKTLLSRRRDSIKLWSSYAALEWQLKHFERADKLYETAISFMHEQNGCILLYRQWASSILFTNQADCVNQCLKILSGVADGKKKTSEISLQAILASRDAIEETLRTGLLSKQYGFAEAAIECLSLLTYTERENGSVQLEKALAVYKNNIDKIESPSSEHEQGLLFAARLIRFDMNRSPMHKVSTLRDHLSQCLSLYPSNAEFLLMYAHNEQKYMIENNVHRMISNILNEEERAVSLFVWQFAVSYDKMLRNKHGVRGIFELAVESNAGRISIDIWLAYVTFELEQGEDAIAKSVLFKAIGACPWSKGKSTMHLILLRPIYD